MFRAGTECIKAEEGGYQEENGAGDEDYRIGGGVRKKAPASGSYGSAGTQGQIPWQICGSSPWNPPRCA